MFFYYTKKWDGLLRSKMHGKMICSIDEKSKIAAQTLLETSKKKVMGCQELKKVAKVFDVKSEKIS